MSTISVSNATANTVIYTPDLTGNVALIASTGIVNSAAVSGAVILPTGTTNARPTGVNGTIRYNTSNSSLEVYVDGNWKNLP